MSGVIYWANKRRILPGVRAIIGNSASGDGGKNTITPPTPPIKVNAILLVDRSPLLLTDKTPLLLIK